MINYDDYDESPIPEPPSRTDLLRGAILLFVAAGGLLVVFMWKVFF
jgi:hypothetical protein